MHGSFVVCLREMVIDKFDLSFWNETLEYSGIDLGFHPISNNEIDDEIALRIIQNLIKKLNLDGRKFGEIFGNYWINYYAKQKYFAFFSSSKSIRDFLQQLNSIHQKITSNLQNPKPPYFEIFWENSNTAEITYKSDRKLIHFAVGLLKALGLFYNEDIAVYRVDKEKIKIFIKSASF